MQVRLLGFRFERKGKLHPSLTLSELAKHLSSKDFQMAEAAAREGEASGASESRRLFLLKECAHAGYLAGLVVTIKDQRVICKLVSEGGHLQVKVSDLGFDTKVMDFNFFVIHKETGAGLYQHYHQSCSVMAFGGLATRRFRSFRDELVQREIEKLAVPSSADEKVKGAIRKKLGTRLSMDLLLRKEKLQQLINELSRVKSFQWTVATPTVDIPEFTSLRDSVRAQTTRLGFTVGTPVSNVAAAIGSFVASNEIARGKVEGEDLDGLERVLRVVSNPENFGEYDFDELAGRLHDLELAKFEEAAIIGELVQACKEHPSIFEKSMKA